MAKKIADILKTKDVKDEANRAKTASKAANKAAKNANKSYEDAQELLCEYDNDC